MHFPSILFFSFSISFQPFYFHSVSFIWFTQFLFFLQSHFSLRFSFQTVAFLSQPLDTLRFNLDSSIFFNHIRPVTYTLAALIKFFFSVMLLLFKYLIVSFTLLNKIPSAVHPFTIISLNYSTIVQCSSRESLLVSPIKSSASIISSSTTPTSVSTVSVSTATSCSLQSLPWDSSSSCFFMFPIQILITTSHFF